MRKQESVKNADSRFRGNEFFKSIHIRFSKITITENILTNGILCRNIFFLI